MSGKGSGSIIGSVAGAIIGAAIGYAVTFPSGGGGALPGAFYGASVGGTIGAVIERVTTPDEVNKQAGVQDLAITGANYGIPIPIVFRKYRVAGNIIQSTNKMQHTHKQDTSPPGKGGPSTINEFTTYTVSLAIGICEGPIKKVTRVWADQTLVYPNGSIDIVDATHFSKLSQTADANQQFVLYYGTEDQTPDPFFETIIGVGNQPAYRGLAYMVMQDLGLGQLGRVPNFTFEVQMVDVDNSEQGSVSMRIGLLHNSLIVAFGFTSNFVVTESLLTLVPIASNAIGVTLPSCLAVGDSGGTSVTVIAGQGDGYDPETGLLTVIFGNDTISSTFTVPARTPTEVSNNDHLLLEAMISNGGTIFWMGSQSETLGNFITSYTYPNTSVDPRTLLASGITNAVTGLVYSSATIMLYAVCSYANTVFKYNASGMSLNLVDTITGLSTSSSSAVDNSGIIVAFDGRIWVVNSGASFVSRFTGSGDRVDVPVGTNPRAIAEATDHFLWVANGLTATLSRINPANDAVTTLSIPGNPIVLAPALNGAMWVVSFEADAVFLVQSDGTFEIINTPSEPRAIVIDASHNAFVSCIGAGVVVRIDATTHKIGFGAEGSGLRNVVTNICNRVGLSSGNIDVSSLDDKQVGFLLNNVQSAKNVLDQLAQLYMFVGIESEGKLKFLQKSSLKSVVTVTESMLSGGIDNPDTSSLIVKRIAEIDLPTKVSFSYASPLRGYQTATQIVQLSNSRLVENPISLTVGFVFDDIDAARTAEALLYELWSFRESFALSLPPSFLLYDPGDVITITSRDFSYKARLTELSVGNNWLHSAQAVISDPDVLTGFGTTSGSPLPPTKAPRQGRAGILVLDVPPLGISDILPRYLAVGFPTQPPRAFSSAALFNSLDNSTYNHKVGLSTDGAVGIVASALPNASFYIWDNINSINVRLFNSARVLESHSDLDVLNGMNYALLGSEVVAFGTATLVSTGVYTLSRLLRGRQGTEWSCGTHGINERFVLLDSVATVQGKVNYGHSDIGLSEYYKVTDPLTGIGTAVAFTQTLSGISIKPWAPALQPSTRDVPSINDVTLNWLHRSRLVEESWVTGSGGVFDVDDTGTYILKIYSDNTYVTVIRTVTTTAYALATGLRSYIYTAAMQVTDFGSVQVNVYYGIASVATIIGYEARAIA